jgi:hypothetical protein
MVAQRDNWMSIDNFLALDRESLDRKCQELNPLEGEELA